MSCKLTIDGTKSSYKRTTGGTKRQRATQNRPILCCFHASAANRGMKEASVLYGHVSYLLYI